MQDPVLKDLKILSQNFEVKLQLKTIKPIKKANQTNYPAVNSNMNPKNLFAIVATSVNKNANPGVKHGDANRSILFRNINEFNSMHLSIQGQTL